MLDKNRRALTKVYAIIIAVIIVVAAIIGVVYWQMSAPSALEKEKILMGIAMHTQVGIWHKAVASYAQWFAEDLGMDTIVVNAEYDPALQIRQVEYLISAGIDGLVWVPAETEATAPVATKCKEAGIPNVTFNEDCDSEDVDLGVTVGYRKIAMLIAKEMLARIEEQYGEVQGPIFEIQGGLETPFSVLIHQGFMDTMDNYPNIDVYSYDVNWDPAESRTKTEQTIIAQGKPTAIFAGGWGPLGDAAHAALEAHEMDYPAGDPEHVIIACGDSSPLFLQNIGEGKEDIAYTEVEQYLAALPVYYCWQMINKGIDVVKSGLPSIGAEIVPADLEYNLIDLGKEHFGINPWAEPQWWPAVMDENLGHLRIMMAGGIITETGTAIALTPEEIGLKTYDDPALYVNQIPLMEENGFEGF
jgi:ribose transport system substrate-binding protein